MEVLGYNFSSPAEQSMVEAFVAGATILAINDDVVDKTIAIRKSKKIKLPDAIISATAVVYSLTLISRNTTDFKNIPGLKFVDSYSL